MAERRYTRGWIACESLRELVYRGHSAGSIELHFTDGAHERAYWSGGRVWHVLDCEWGDPVGVDAAREMVEVVIARALGLLRRVLLENGAGL